MNLSKSDCLAIQDFPEILSYHIAEGIWLEEDLFDEKVEQLIEKLLKER